MARIPDASDTWSAPVSLLSDEVWQARDGSVYLTTTASPEPDEGIFLMDGGAVLLSAGRAVACRRVGLVATVIVRESV